MRVAVDFQNERLDLDVPEDRLVAEWHAPEGLDAAETFSLVRDALQSPWQYPPLRQAVVPGDQVVVALDLAIPEPAGVLRAICATLGEGGVDTGSITVLTASEASADMRGSPALPEGITWAVHDPDDRNRLAYLASTAMGRRVYLDRLLTDADVVVPVGRLAYDRVLGYRGPWSLLFPDLSDRETARSFQDMAGADWPDREHPPRALEEAAEVSWLLGSQFHLGIVAGARGPAEAVAGLESVVRSDGTRCLDHAWTFEADSRADLVLVGIGQAGIAATLEHLAAALTNAERLVAHGGKIVVLSRAEGTIGPALKRVLAVDDPRLATSATRGHESDPDHALACQFARAMAWADVYLLSALDAQVIEESPLAPLARPEEVRRLVAVSRSCLLLSQAESVRACVAGEAHHHAARADIGSQSR
jgi:nickel-dependent lactate racemase